MTISGPEVVRDRLGRPVEAFILLKCSICRLPVNVVVEEPHIVTDSAYFETKIACSAGHEVAIEASMHALAELAVRGTRTSVTQSLSEIFDRG